MTNKFVHWSFTSYGEKPLFEESWQKHLVVGHEIAPTTGRPHWQCALTTHNPLVYKTVFERLKLKPDGSKLEVSRDPVASAGYCRKGLIGIHLGEPCALNAVDEYGKAFRENQGTRFDLDELKNDILTGKRKLDDILEDTPKAYHQYGRTLVEVDKLREKRLRPVTGHRKIVWLWGPSGTGKSLRAHIMMHSYRECDVYKWVWPPQGGVAWQDEYDDEIVIWMEEIRWMPLADMILLIDSKGGAPVPRRGRAAKKCKALTFIITSSKSPEMIWPSDDGNRARQIVRRIEEGGGEVKHLNVVEPDILKTLGDQLDELNEARNLHPNPRSLPPEALRPSD